METINICESCIYLCGVGCRQDRLSAPMLILNRSDALNVLAHIISKEKTNQVNGNAAMQTPHFRMKTGAVMNSSLVSSYCC